MNKTDRIEIRVTPEFKRKLKDKCAELNIPMSAYLLSQLVEPDWVSKIKVREGRPPSKSIFRPPRPPQAIRQMRVDKGVIETLNNTNMIRELKQVIFNGVDEFFKPYDYVEPDDLEEKARIASQKMKEKEENEMQRLREENKKLDKSSLVPPS